MGTRVRRPSFVLGLCLGAIAIAATAPAKPEFSCAVSPALEERSREFLFASNILNHNEEQQFERWVLTKVINASSCLLVFRDCAVAKRTLKCDHTPLEVIAMKADGSFARFETAVKAPARMRVAVGDIKPELVKQPDGRYKSAAELPTDFYYVDLIGPSALAAAKSISVGEAVCGFSGELKNGRAEFDPTPNRSWRVSNAVFDLRRVNGSEINNLRPRALDGDFETLRENANGKVVPWNACYIRSYFDAGKNTWVKAMFSVPR